jgi:hypothetical protein
MRPIKQKWSILLVTGTIGMAVVIAGCGGSSYGSSPAPTSSSAPAAGGSGEPAEPSTQGAGTAGIPQHNGGDRDADNNGGPSDGDGNQ